MLRLLASTCVVVLVLFVFFIFSTSLVPGSYCILETSHVVGNFCMLFNVPMEQIVMQPSITGYQDSPAITLDIL